MKTHPIIMDDESICSIREGCKTQTRRVVKPQPDHPLKCGTNERWYMISEHGSDISDPGRCCPYGQPGDLLWVRETWFYGYVEWDGERKDPADGSQRCFYAADGDGPEHIDDGDGYAVLRKDGTPRSPWKASIHMPRKHSRLTLEVESVRVERVQKISEADAKAEGVYWQDMPPGQQKLVERLRVAQQYKGRPDLVNNMGFAAQAAFQVRWDSLNAKHAPWSSNPWVWVVTFKPIWSNIDNVIRKREHAATV